MKIIFITTSFHPNKGGVEKHLYSLCRELLTRNHSISILAPKVAHHHDRESFEEIKISRFLSRPFTIAWLSIWKFRRDIKEADIVHLHDYSTYIWAWPYLLMYRKPFFITFHGWEGRIPLSQAVIMLRRWIERRAKGVIIIGEYIRKWYGQNNNIILYGGITKEEIATDRSPTYFNRNRIMFSGRLELDTGIKEYFVLFNKLKLINPDIKISIAGDGSLRSELEAYAKVNNLACTFLGRLESISEQLANHDIICTSGYLGIIEALAKNKIVIGLYDNPLKEDYLKKSPFAKYTIIDNNIDHVISRLQSSEFMDTLVDDISKIDFTEFTWSHVTDVYLGLWNHANERKN